MLIYAAATVPGRRRTNLDPPKVVRMPGPPLWWLILAELASDFGKLWKRITALAKRTRALLSSPARKDSPSPRPTPANPPDGCGHTLPTGTTTVGHLAW